MKKKILGILILLIAALAAVEIYPIISKRTAGMTSSVFDGFEVFYRPSDEGGARAVAQALNRSRDRLAEVLRYRESKPVSVYVYHSRKDMHARRYGAVLKLLKLDWWIGDNTKNSVLIINPGDSDASPGHRHILTASVHEYIHVITDRLYPRTSKWLKEGLACFLAGQGPSESLLSHSARPPFGLVKIKNPVKFANAGGYQFSYTYVEFLTERYGWQSFRDLLHSKEDYPAVLKKSEHDIYSEWMDFLSTRYNKAPSGS